MFDFRFNLKNIHKSGVCSPRREGGWKDKTPLKGIGISFKRDKNVVAHMGVTGVRDGSCGQL